ncbi:Ig-like domain repeat protein, partial [uncultured Methanobrevibacter sp.]|uniref:Ig-like domain repeat protein n=1 Tax=uncultured Methanobrevibacter sp. TaxID=253161 RepID=UPI0025EE39DE
SLTTNNKTVNITAKSNIFSEVMPGKLLFILPNGTQINATYGTNGTWWAEHTFDAYGEYKINATYVGLDNVTINNGTITINKVNSTITLDNIVLDYGETKNVTVTTTGATGITAKIDGNNVTVINNYTIQIPVLDAGTYNLTVTTIPDDDHNPVTKEVNITVNKVNSTLTLDDVVLDYGESKSITVTTEGATGITAKIDGVDVTVSNYTIPISGLSAGNYTLTVTTIADKNHNPVTKEANINVNKVESTLTVGDIVFDYGSEGSGDVYFTGASEVTANVVNQPSAVVSVSGNKISVSGLAAGTYTLNVTTVPDENHTAVTETATITVNKVNSTLTLDDVVLDYGETKNITVTTGGATGITAKIDGVNVTVNGYTIPISGLGAGNYTLSVTTIPDDNHNPVNVTSKITVNKVESTLTVGDIVFDYDGEGSGDVSFTGASKVTANVINQPKAVVSVNDNKITVSGLAAGTYTLNVTTVPDENHTAVTETAGITVNKINSTLTLDDVELDYGDSKNVTVATEGATGITAKIDGVNVTVNGYTIPISGLGAGNYTLTVTTIPDDNHNPVNVTSKITVNKVESTLTVGDIVFDYDGEGSGDVSFTGASEVLANVVNQPSAVISVNDNKITVSGLGAGTYTLNVTNVPDENHTAVTETATITVNKINSTLTLDDVELDYGDSKNVTVATEGATGITAKIDGVNVTVNGYTIPISGLGAGNYTLTVTTIADKNHNPVTKEANITVNKVNATLTVNDVVLDYGESKNITVTTEGATGITAKIDGANVTVNGYTIPISGLGAGNYTLTVTTIADKNHNPVTKEVNITVNKLSTEIILANETLDLKVGDEVPVLANLTPAGAGNLTFTSSNEDLVFVEDNVTIVANSQGQAIITVSFAGNENYTAAENKTITVNVALNDASVSVENDTLNLKVDETSAINATINPDTIMLKIKYTSSNESVAIVDKNGIVTAVGEGRAIITIEVGDDEIYAKISTTVTVTVNKINTTADVSIPENITVGDNSTVNVVLPADAKGNVTVKVDDEVVDTVPVKDGNADVTIPSMSAGNHTVEIAYSGDGKYNPVNETKEISVSKNDITPEITIPSDIEFGDNATVDIKLPDDSTGNVTLTVDGKEINTVPVTNGTASVKLPALDAGNHTAEIAYSGDDKYKSASKTTTISIDKDSTKITAADVTATYKVDKYLVITLKDSKGNPLANASVTVDLNTIKNYTTDENGQIKIKVSNLVPKTYNAKITFAGNNNYLGSDATAKVVVKKATPKITASNKMFKTTTKNKKYTITLKDNTGKPIKNAKVYLKVNGKTYKATTNSKGKATFKITKLSKTGTFKATVTYKGNKYFNKASKKVTVKVISTWKTISKGSKAKSTVKEIQRALKNNGYYLTAYGHYLKVDGIYWDYTVKAVKQFQKAKGLKVTGKVDEKTAKKLGII